MKRCLLSFFLLLVITTAVAQSSATATASAAIVHPVGAFGLEEEREEQGLFTVAAYAKAFLVAVQTSSQSLSRFSVVSNSFVYTVAVLPYVTENNVLRKVEENSLLPVEIITMTTATSHAYVLNTSATPQSMRQPLPAQKLVPDVAIHFN
jgi:hypothetical protein